jgi:hypothetical protein
MLRHRELNKWQLSRRKFRPNASLHFVVCYVGPYTFCEVYSVPCNSEPTYQYATAGPRLTANSLPAAEVTYCRREYHITWDTQYMTFRSVL